MPEPGNTGTIFSDHVVILGCAIRLNNLKRLHGNGEQLHYWHEQGVKRGSEECFPWRFFPTLCLESFPRFPNFFCMLTGRALTSLAGAEEAFLGGIVDEDGFGVLVGN